MAITRYQAELSRTFDAPRELVWELVADSNRWDRLSGLAAPIYSYREEDGVRVRYAEAKEFGVSMRWIEPPYRWVRGGFLEGERRFIGGPIHRGGFTVTVERQGTKTLARAVGWVDVDTLVGAAIALVVRRRFHSALDVLLSSVARLLDEPAAEEQSGRDLLLNHAAPHLNGECSPTNAQILEKRLSQLSHRRAAPEFIRAFRRHIIEQPDEALSQMRAFELARVWQMDRSVCLRDFLNATELGLVDLNWQVNCPVCRVSADVQSGLSDLEQSVHCDACNIAYDVDFGKHVEAVFTVSPALREVTPKVYCESTPMFRPHVFAQLTVESGSTSDYRPPRLPQLPVGNVVVRVLGRSGAEEVTLTEGTQRVLVTITRDGLTVETSAEGTTALSIANQSGSSQTVSLETTQVDHDATSGAFVATFPEFSNLFATEAPASGVELQVGHLAVLFSDLTGSTALYSDIGDARAFAIVEQHFQIMRRVIGEHRGSVVKTMGDAVMATFASEAEAIKAAVAIVDAHRSIDLGPGVGVKLGVHAGPCLAVRANNLLDFFGTTVNVAARLQARAGSGELVLSENLGRDPDIAELLKGYAVREFSAELKGIHEDQQLLGFAIDGAAEAS